MTHAQHTPGFWHEAHGRVYTQHGTAICDTRQPLISAEAQEANARLIAAAPDLLAALLPLVEASPVGGGMMRFDGEELAAARNAIAKAKGE